MSGKKDQFDARWLALLVVGAVVGCGAPNRTGNQGTGRGGAGGGAGSGGASGAAGGGVGGGSGGASAAAGGGPGAGGATGGAGGSSGAGSGGAVGGGSGGSGTGGPGGSATAGSGGSAAGASGGTGGAAGGRGGTGGAASGGTGGAGSGGTGGTAGGTGGAATGGTGGAGGGTGGAATGGTGGTGGAAGGTGGGAGAGGSGRGGSSAGGASGAGGTPICGPASAFATEEGGYIRAAPWKGYAFVATESPSLGTIMIPTSFSAFRTGEVFATYGYVKGDPNPALRGFARIGFNVNQAVSGMPNGGAPWVPTGCSGVAFDLDLTSSWILPRVQLTAASGSPPQTWCAATTSGRPGSFPWSSFNISCADGSAITPYDGVTPLTSVALLMPGGTIPYQDQSNYFDFIVRNLAPY